MIDLGVWDDGTGVMGVTVEMLCEDNHSLPAGMIYIMNETYASHGGAVTA